MRRRQPVLATYVALVPERQDFSKRAIVLASWSRLTSKKNMFSYSVNYSNTNKPDRILACGIVRNLCACITAISRCSPGAGAQNGAVNFQSLVCPLDHGVSKGNIH